MTLLKAIHRWISIVFGLFLLLLAISGVWIQFEPNRLDAVHPGRMDDAIVLQTFAERLQGFHTLRPESGISGFGMNISGEQPYVSFNILPAGNAAGAPGTQRESIALALRTGELMPPESVLHGVLLRFHSSFFIGTTGRLIGIGAGLTLLYLCCSGLYFYVELLLRRFSRGRKALFWATPVPLGTLETHATAPSAVSGWMRDAHRWLTTVFVVFLLVIAGTGLLMQTGPTGLHLWPFGQNGVGPDMPQTSSAGFTDEQLMTLLKQSMVNARLTDKEPQKLFMLDLNGGGNEARLALTYESHDAGMYSRLYKAESGVEYPQPESSFFFLLRLHRGDLFHEPGVWVNIVSGVGLGLLGISGLMIYLAMLRRRKLLGKRELFWS